MTLKDILADKSLGDQAIITLQNGSTYTLGELRSLSAEDKRSLSQREETLIRKEKELATKLEELAGAQQTTARLFEDVTRREELLKVARPPAAGSNDDPFAPLDQLANDNILGPVVKLLKAKMTSQEAAIAAQLEQAKQLDTRIKQMTEAYIGDQLINTYEALVPADKRGELTMEKLVKHGLDNGYKTRTGYVDIRRAHAELTQADTLAAAEAAMRDRLTKEITEELAKKGISVAGPAGGGFSSRDLLPGSDRQPSQFKSVDEALAAAAKDPDIWRNFSTNMPIQ